jgi:26S proteasome regulatory subunit N2
MDVDEEKKDTEKKEEEGKKKEEEVKKEEPLFEILSNPARVMKPQLQVSCVDYHFQITSFPVSL